MGRSRGLFAVLIAVVASAAAPSAAADVWTVDPSGSGDFVAVELAIATAADGDVIIIQPGLYTPPAPLLVDKGLTLIGAGSAADVQIRNTLEVHDLPAGSTVLLRQMRLFSWTLFAGPALDIADSGGRVWVEDCELLGTDGTGYAFINATAGQTALRLTGSAGVTLVRSTLRGGDGNDGLVGPLFVTPTTAAAPAMILDGGSAQLFDCTLAGGLGGQGPFPDDIAASGAGLLLLGGTLFSSGATLDGGEGPIPAASLVITSGQDQVELLDSTLPDGLAGPVEGVTEWPGTARGFALTSPVVELGPVTVTAHGQAGDALLVLIAFDAGLFPIDGVTGPLVLDPLGFTGPFELGNVPAGGTLEFTATVPELPMPGFGASTFLVQGFFLDGADIVAGPGSALVLVEG